MIIVDNNWQTIMDNADDNDDHDNGGQWIMDANHG